MNPMRPHVLIVDDQVDNLMILEDLLESNYRVHSAASGQDALAALDREPDIDLILLDVVMPGVDGFEVCQRVKAHPRHHHTPVLFLTSLESAADEAKGLALGAEDFIHKPFKAPVVLARVQNHIKLAQMTRLLKSRNEDLEHLVEERTRQMVEQTQTLMRREQELIAAQGATITAFCALAEARDNETGNHIRRTQNYLLALAERLRHHPRFRDQLDDQAIELLFKSAPLHDIGKVAISDAVLRKPGRLDPHEWEEMKQHAEFGRAAIAQAEQELGQTQGEFLRYAREIAYCHHEKWDGSGYPQGLAGEAIPLSARLMAAADVYDALISVRVYKPAYPHERAIALIRDGRGTHFDPDVADAVIDLADTFNDIAVRFADDDEAPVRDAG